MSKEIKIESSKSTAITILHDARTELRTAADSGVELAEKLTGGLFRFVRKLNQRLDESSGEALDGVERVLTSSKKAREAKRAAKRDAKQDKRADNQSARA
jgi:hypothetical protein